MWDAIPSDPGPSLFANHSEGETQPEGSLQPGQQLPCPITERKVGLKYSSFERTPRTGVTLLCGEETNTEGMSKITVSVKDTSAEISSIK